MKHNTRRLLGLVLALAMLVSMFAVASGEQDIIDLGGEIVIDGGTDIDTQGEEGELEIELDEGEGLPDGENDPEGGEDLNLGLDLNAAALEGNEEELAPVTGEAMMASTGTQSDPIVVNTWNELNTALMQGNKQSGEGAGNPTYYKLGGNIEQTSGNNPISVESGRYVVLDLNGCTIDKKQGETDPLGHVIDVMGNLTITGTITGGKGSTYGGGVYVDSNATLTMKGGTITGNNSSNNGGGVYVKGSFTMEGGTISGNTAQDGGGVYVDGGTFTMSSGTIGGTDKNIAKDGCGVYVGKQGTFNMSDGKISGNEATGNSGSSGGGVYVDSGTFNMSGGIIGGAAEGNVAKDGGGVRVFGGTFNMFRNSEISGNTAKGTNGGGGVRLTNSAKFNMSDTSKQVKEA